MGDGTVSATFEDKPLSYEQRLWRWRILTSTYFGYAGYYLCRKVFTLCKTTLSDELGVGLDKIAHIWTAYLVAYMIGQFLNSYLGRRWGSRILLLGGFGASILINVIFGFVNSYATFLMFMVFNGLVQATGWPASVGSVSEWLRKRERGRIMGIWSTSYQVGNITVKYLGAFLLGAYGWRWSFWGCTMVSFAIWWLIYFWQRNKPQDVGLEPIVAPEKQDLRAIQASTAERVTFGEYIGLAVNPVILAMGISYFCVKFLRYTLDSWLPTYLNILGLDKAQAGYFSAFFDYGGIIPAIVAGWALDRVFRGNWAKLCFVMALGMIGSYIVVLQFDTHAVAVAVCFGLVGFMVYGPDTILSGVAAVQVAGEKNGVAVAGLVNGIGSAGPIFQEEIVGWLLGKGDRAGIHQANTLGLYITIAFAFLMLVVMWRLRVASTQTRQAPGAN